MILLEFKRENKYLYNYLSSNQKHTYMYLHNLEFLTTQTSVVEFN